MTDIPGGAFSVRAEVLSQDTLPEGCQLALALYDANGTMRELRMEPLSNTGTVFAVDNTDGWTASGKLFLLNPELSPMSPAVSIAP